MLLSALSLLSKSLIIVLLILVAISIATLTEQNGILKKAETAQKKEFLKVANAR